MAFNPAAATQAYIDTLSAEELALARDYTMGNHWLILAGLIVSALVTWLIVKSGVLEKIYAKLPENWPNLRVYVVAALFSLVSTIITLPYLIYTDWWRESQYGRTSQPLGDYLGQSASSIVLSTLLGSLLIVGVYFLIRRTGKFWWAWSGGLVAAFTALTMLLSPTLIEPLFNDFEPIPEGEVRGIAVLTFVVGLAFTLVNPALNAVVRMGEREADAYSMETVGLPDAMAGALIKTAEYRYPLAGPVEEAIFYTHPSVEQRIRTAMDWKAANPPKKAAPAPE